MNGAKLQIIHHKTDVLLVSNFKVVQRLQITVEGHVIALKRALKQLGVISDDWLNFNNHVHLRNFGLLSNVSSSILRYGAPTCGSTLKAKRNREKLTRTFRLVVVRGAIAYRRQYALSPR
ncbi:uncharacterized protein LOC131679786 [Topomyia yanbarensis]|uniref:uncharacterized protein LOC131679786 n=1 Tax=Topomyia yanbarensis TaxID=2498891 RepID=UPI00273B063F|nr:uncharacterized protein LOC131679786 [Topomyia yanbarensis]